MNYSSRLQSEEMDILFDGILQLKSREECYRFFEDLCTIQELQELSQRFYVAILLRNNMKYSDIIKRSTASSATISRINKALHYGADGYNLVFDKMEESEIMPVIEGFEVSTRGRKKKKF